MVQRTQFLDGVQQVDVGADRLVNLEGLGVHEVDLDEAGGRVVHLLTAADAAAACPACGVISASLKERITTRPRDISYGESPLCLVWHKNRWRCRDRRRLRRRGGCWCPFRVVVADRARRVHHPHHPRTGGAAAAGVRARH